MYLVNILIWTNHVYIVWIKHSIQFIRCLYESDSIIRELSRKAQDFFDSEEMFLKSTGLAVLSVQSVLPFDDYLVFSLYQLPWWSVVCSHLPT